MARVGRGRSSERPAAREPSGAGRLTGSVAYLVVGLMATTCLAYPVYYLGWDEELTLELGSAAIMVVGVCLLGGAGMLRPSRRAMTGVWRLGWPIIAISVVLCGMQAWSFVADGARLSSHWLQSLGYYLLFCMGIGVFEECYVRGLVLNGLLARLGRTRRGVTFSLALAALFFGALHISWATLDYGSPYEVAQALLKVAQTSIYGVVLSVAVMDSGNLTGAALFHALDDFLVMLVPYVLYGEELSVSYVSSDASEARGTIVMYVVLVVLYLPSLAKALRRLRVMGLPQRGAFVGTDEVRPAPRVAQRAKDPSPAGPRHLARR